MELFEEFEQIKKDTKAKAALFIQGIQADKKIVNDEKEEKYAQIKELNKAREVLAKELNELEVKYKEAVVKGKDTDAEKIFSQMTAKKAEIEKNLYKVEALKEYAAKKVIKQPAWESNQNDFIELVAERYDIQAQLVAKRKEAEAQLDELKKLIEEIKREESRILINPYSEETSAIVALYEESFGTIDTSGATISNREAAFDFIRKDYRRIENMAQVIKMREEEAKKEEAENEDTANNG